MNKDPKRKLPLSVKPDSRTDEETIRKRAYELYVERGMEDGHDLEDWFRAEEELLGKGTRCRSVTSPPLIANGGCRDLSRGIRHPSLWTPGTASEEFCCAAECPALSP